MEQKINELLTEEVFQKISNHCGVSKDEFKKIGDFENYIFSFEKDKKNTFFV